jgi:hypothetical protein
MTFLLPIKAPKTNDPTETPTKTKQKKSAFVACLGQWKPEILAGIGNFGIQLFSVHAAAACELPAYWLSAAHSFKP